MPEDLICIGDVDLCYETFGDPADPALLLVMGLGTQMLGWHEDFCAELAGRGFHVVRFDNRDAGRSSFLERHRPPTSLELLRRDKRVAGYSLAEMADDGIGLLGALGLERAHVVGASMGGMIAQLMAARHPARVLSLASLMSNTGARWSGQPRLSAYPMLLRRAPTDRERYLEHFMRNLRRVGSPGFERDETDLLRIAERAFERGLNPAGSARQLAAIIASGDRTPQLRMIRCPTVVIHGTKDKLVRPSGGRATARAIPGARLVEIPGLGHELSRGAWPVMIGAIVENAARAGEAEGAAQAV